MKIQAVRTHFYILLLALAVTACGKPAAHQLTPEQEAYQLMDKGNNAEAALVLEDELTRNPDNLRAKKLLGSAYVGLAGIDVYSIQASFEDILFRKSLKDQIFGSPGGPEKKADADEAKLKGGELMVRRLDNGFVTLQKLLVYLSRFPQVTEDKWPYLQKALTELDGLDETSDVAVYRILIRMIYIKSYLVERVIKDEEFGTKRWACTFNPADLQDGMNFINIQLNGIRDDLNIAVKRGAKRLTQASGIINTLASQAEITDAILALSESRTLQEGESQLRSLFGCEKI